MKERSPTPSFPQVTKADNAVDAFNRDCAPTCGAFRSLGAVIRSSLPMALSDDPMGCQDEDMGEAA